MSALAAPSGVTSDWDQDTCGDPWALHRSRRQPPQARRRPFEAVPVRRARCGAVRFGAEELPAALNLRRGSVSLCIYQDPHLHSN